MKQYTIGGFTILGVLNLILCYHVFFAKSQAVYVDANKLLENYEGMKIARQEFQQKALQWQANIDTLKAELDREIAKYESGKASMSKKEKSLSEELIKTKRKQFVDYQQGIQQQSQNEDMKMTQSVLSEVNTFIEDYGKQNGYTLILGATNMGNIIYAEEALDITEELQEALNDHYLGL